MPLRLPVHRRPKTNGPIGESEPSALPAGSVRRLTVGDVLMSGAGATVAALLVRLLLNVPTPAELFGDRFTVLIPLPLFSALLGVFGPGAKHLFFVSLLLGEWLMMSLAGLTYLRLQGILVRRGLLPIRSLGLWDLIVLPLCLWIVSAGILAPALGGGLFGSGLTGGIGMVLTSQLVPNVVFAGTLVWMLRREQSATGADAGQPSSVALSRRRLLRQAASALAIVAGGAVAWEAFSSGLASLFGFSGKQVARINASSQPGMIVPPPIPEYGAWTTVSGLTPEVTSARDFYYVSKNLVGDPQITTDTWQLQITGLVNTPYSLSYAELLALPRVEQYHTLECISNDVGGNLISNALFTGVRLADVLNRAGVRTGASEMIFHAADGYSDSLHLSQALDPDALIVFLINGEALPEAHGFPARLLIPGVYGMKNGKWLVSLELGPGGYTGYWEQQGWTREARVKLMSQIDVPRDGDFLTPHATFVAGVAYAGNRGVARVDVSTDGGRTWEPAVLRRPLGNLTWVLWEHRWSPLPGHYEIVVRAVDLQGLVQSSMYLPPLPSGASGYHAVNISVG